MNYKVKNNKGFSLIELMVATSIFVVIMLTAIGSLFSLLDASKNSRALRTSMDNINFAMESMTRSLRMGNNYYCTDESGLSSIMYDIEATHDCPNGNNAIAFLPEENSTERVGYKLEADSLKRCQGSDPSSCVDMVASNVRVTHLKFFTFGSENSDTQAGTYIIIKGEVDVKDVPIPFSLQTMVSSRNF